MHAGQYALPFLRGDDDCVDIFAFEEFVIVLVDGPVGLFACFESFRLGQIAVAEGDDLAIFGKLVKQQRGSAADTDGSDGDAVVGSGFTIGCQHIARNEMGRRHRAGCSGNSDFQQLASCELTH